MSLLGIIQIPFDRYFQKQREGLLRTLCSILIFLFSLVNAVTFTKPIVIYCLNFEINNKIAPVRGCGTLHRFLFTSINYFGSNCILCNFKNI